MAGTVNLGVIGAGYWGSKLIKKFSSLGNVKISTVADLDKNRLFPIKNSFPKIKTVIDYKQVTNDNNINAIVIATPVSTHFRVAKEALLSGKNVFIEKPLSQTLKSAKELTNIARKNKLTITTDFTYLYHPAIQKIKEMITRGKLGKILFIQSVRMGLELFPKGVDVVWDLAPHDISIILYLFDKMPKKINIFKNGIINKDTPDTSFINLNFSGKLSAQIINSWLSPVKVRHFVIGGTRGTLVFDETKTSQLLFFNTEIEKYNKPRIHSNKIKSFIKNIEISNPENLPSNKQDFAVRGKHRIFQPSQKGKKISFQNQEALLEICQNFINSIKNRELTDQKTDLSLKTVEILEKLQ